MTPTLTWVFLCGSPFAGKFQNLSHKTMVVGEWKLSHDFFFTISSAFYFYNILKWTFDVQIMGSWNLKESFKYALKSWQVYWSKEL
jgi:hypothetical protein